MHSLKRIVAMSTLGGLLVAAAAFAHAPTVVLDPIGTLSYASFPQAYSVTGTVTHTNNVSSAKDLTLTINGVTEGSTVVSPFAGNTTDSASFALPWNITGPGTYTVEVSIRHGNDTGTDEEIVLVESTTVIVESCDAAPGVAAHYLKSLGVKAGSKTFKNVVSLVAQYMGPQTDFDGVAACDEEPYAVAVQAYVDANMSVPK